MSPDELGVVQPVRRSVDARHRPPMLQLQVKVYEKNETPTEDFRTQFAYKEVDSCPPVIVVGAGPAGLFASLRLLEIGLKPIIIERGKSVSERKLDIARIARQHTVDEHSNWCFGEGGAGTYSDGKLYTRSTKRGNVERVLQQLVMHGANPDILLDTHAHVGTDKLSAIIAAIRQTIVGCGGEYRFGTHVRDLMVQNGAVVGVLDAHGGQHRGVAVILATGHSASEVYELFASRRWAIEAKPFALGVRVEHPQQLVNEIQYHGNRYSSLLPPASYSLAAQVEGRGVFSFCMCPGGIVVPAATAEGEVVVNGMSNSQRNSPFANAGVVAQVNIGADLRGFERHGELAGLRFRQHVEQAMFAAGDAPLSAPAQRLSDFVRGQFSASLCKTSYLAGVTSAPLHELLPAFVSHSLRRALLEFDKKMHGYLTEEAVLMGVESRTSSPVRIPRDPHTMQHPQLRNLYPCGEGAGYAGGITSSAVDGVAAAEAIFRSREAFTNATNSG
jgi:uncharacterized FAD-dependent dehydrogenase